MKKLVFILFILIISQSIVESQPISALPKIPFNTGEHWLFRSVKDTSVGQWTRISPLPRALYGITTYFWQDSNKILICGGADSLGINSKNCYFYNITANTYEPKPSLPVGRAFGKLVRVADSLYLIGSIGPNFHLPDGAVYKFAPNSDTAWIVKTPCPSPVLQEMAVCVYHDTAIFTIGGSTDGFTGVTNIIRAYVPEIDTWINYLFAFPQPLSTADAECIGEDFVVTGGFDGTVLNTIYQASYSRDSLSWTLLPDSTNPFIQGIYRVGGGAVNNLMLFGPGLRDTASSGEIWGYFPHSGPWVHFLPNTLDTAGDIPTIAVKAASDSMFFYLFGGILPGINPVRVTAISERYSIINPFIGIHGISNTVPKTFHLYQNYPNPFNPSTFITFDIPKASLVRLTVYDILGREVNVIMNEFKPAGSYRVEFSGGNFASGIYFYRITAGIYSETKKMILLK